MPLKYEKVFIPIMHGLDQSIDERIRPKDVPDLVENAYYDKLGLLEKRPGFTPVAYTVEFGHSLYGPDTTGRVRGIFSNGKELCVIGQESLFAFNEKDRKMYHRGQISPCTLEQDIEFKGQWSFSCADLAENDGWVMTACQGFRLNPDTGTEWAIFVKVKSSDGQQTFVDTVIGQTKTYANRLHSPRVCACDGKLLLLCMKGAHTDAQQDLVLYQWLTSTPYTTPSLVGNITTNIRQAAQDSPYNNIRTFDAIELLNGNYLVAFVDDTAGNVIVRVYNSAHVQQSTNTLVGWHTRVAVCDAASGLEDQVYILTDAVVEDIHEILLYSYKRSDLTQDCFGPSPITLEILGMGKTPDNFACRVGKSGFFHRCENVWGVIYDPGSGADWVELHSRSCSTAGTVLSAMNVTYNALPMSRPFFNLRKFYIQTYFNFEGVEIAGVGPYHNDLAYYSSSCVVDLHTATTEGTSSIPKLAAIFDVGVSPAGGVDAGQLIQRVGSCNHSEKLSLPLGLGGGLLEMRFMCINAALINVDRENIYSANQIKVDFGTKRPTVATVERRGTLIGGGYVSWYSGDRVHELGYVFLPIFHSDTAIGLGGDIPAGTYNWVAIWEAFNFDTGSLNRSAPGRRIQFTFEEDYNDLVLDLYSMPFSHRVNDQIGAIIYRAGADGLYYRVNEPHRPVPNRISAAHLLTYDDTYVWPPTSAPLLYTMSGDIENVTPVASRICSVGLGRAWIGEQADISRIQFSDEYQMETSTQYAIAPEWNEAQSQTMSDGLRVTGMCEMDDKMVIFTEKSIYLLAGDGPTKSLSGGFSKLTLVTSDTGCIEPASVIKYPDGILFMGSSGIQSLTRGLDIEFVGKSVEDEFSSFPVISSASLCEWNSQVRFTCLNDSEDDCIILVYNYEFKAWAKWIPSDGAGGPLVAIGGCVHDGRYYLIMEDGHLYVDDYATSYDNADYTVFRWRSGWIQEALQGGMCRCKSITPLLLKQSNHGLIVKLYSDYESTAYKTATFTQAEINSFDNPDEREQPRISVDKQRAQSHMFEIYDYETDVLASGKGFKLAGVIMEIAFKKGTARTPETQRG